MDIYVSKRVYNARTARFIIINGKSYKKLLREGYKNVKSLTQYMVPGYNKDWPSLIPPLSIIAGIKRGYSSSITVRSAVKGGMDLFTIEKNGQTALQNLIQMNYSENELSKILETYDRKRNQARRRLRDRFGFNDKQISVLIPAQKGGRLKDVNLATIDPHNPEGTIRELAQRILRDNLGEKDTNAECVKLVKTAINENAGSSRLSRLGRELRILGVSSAIIESTKIPEITRKANEIQKEQRQKAEDAGKIEYPDHFSLESVKERLDSYDIKTLPDIQALADVMIMLCIRPVEIITLRITDTGVTGYAKNRDQQDIPRIFRSMEKDEKRAKELLIWIQDAISSGKIKSPGKPGAKSLNKFLKQYGLLPRYLRKIGAVYAVVSHDARSLGQAMTIAQQELRHSPRNNESPVRNYIIVKFRRRGEPPEEARLFRIYDEK
ncbi:4701_t:CDS:2 [Entrophospora sp. SA101]|nr:4701_t:CDS:2 [Entrophospora sp. SA101]